MVGPALVEGTLPLLRLLPVLLRWGNPACPCWRASAAGSVHKGVRASTGQGGCPPQATRLPGARSRARRVDTRGGPAPSPRDSHSAVVFRSRMIILGGDDSQSYCNDAWAFDPAHERWTQIMASSKLPPLLLLARWTVGKSPALALACVSLSQPP